MQFTHGFSSRNGGVSRGAYAGLNLSSNVGDETGSVEQNRALALTALGLSTVRLARLRQVHSSTVVNAQPDVMMEADGLVTKEPNLGLVIETADCYPLLFEDAEAGVVGAAHAGWRGTVSGVALNTLRAMLELGARTDRVRVAIGPGISATRYEVGQEVRERFLDAGFPHSIWAESRVPALTGAFAPGASGAAAPGASSASGVNASQSAILSNVPINRETTSETGLSWRVDLGLANAWLLEAAGIPHESIWRAGLCSSDEHFFSYRRDHGQTGRMWALIARTHRRAS